MATVGFVKEVQDRKSEIETTTTKQFACHSVWIGPNRLPTAAIFSLYEKFEMYLKQVNSSKETGIFLPSLCLGGSAVEKLSSAHVAIRLVTLDECPHDSIRNAARNLIGCKQILRIDMPGSKQPGFIPVLVWEDLFEIMSKKLSSIESELENERFKKALKYADSFPDRSKLIERVEWAQSKGYFSDGSMFNFLNENVNFLCKNQQYAAASDIVRLLLLTVNPGCYVDISDVLLKKIPSKEDISVSVPFLTRGNENDFIICLDDKIAIRILMMMYAFIRKNREEDYAGRYAEPSYLSEEAHEIVKSEIRSKSQDLNSFANIRAKGYHGLFHIMESPSGYFLSVGSWYVNQAAGFSAWESINKKPHLLYAATYNEAFDDAGAHTLKCILASGSESRSKSAFSWSTPGLPFIQKLQFLPNLFKDENLYDVAEKEISSLSKQYGIGSSEIIKMSIIADSINGETPKEEIKSIYETALLRAEAFIEKLKNHKKTVDQVQPVTFSPSAQRVVNPAIQIAVPQVSMRPEKETAVTEKASEKGTFSIPRKVKQYALVGGMAITFGFVLFKMFNKGSESIPSVSKPGNGSRPKI